jgi:hypothetical protein
VAGRKASVMPVNWLKNRHFSVMDNPKELNFAIVGDLQLTVVDAYAGGSYYSGPLTCRNVALAQGHNIANNWWMFSNKPITDAFDYNQGGMMFEKNKKLQIRCEGGTKNRYTYDVDLSADTANMFRFIDIAFVSAARETEAPLHNFIDGAILGQVSDSVMEPDLAANFRRGMPPMQASLDRLGPVKSLQFAGPGPNNADRYTATHESGTSSWLVTIDSDGLINGLAWGM